MSDRVRRGKTRPSCTNDMSTRTREDPDDRRGHQGPYSPEWGADPPKARPLFVPIGGKGVAENNPCA